MKRRIYLASSWRNARQPAVLAALREAGHEVYDFRNPHPGNTGFQWSEIDPNWENWSIPEYLSALMHPIAAEGFANDFNAMQWADTGVLLLPCGRSAHLEAGYFAGVPGKRLHVLIEVEQEPELMYMMAHGIHRSVEALIERLAVKS